MRNGTRILTLLLGTLAVSPSRDAGTLAGQEAPHLDPGARIRVSSPPLRHLVPDLTVWDVFWGDPASARERKLRGRVVGTVLDADADTLRMEVAKTEARVALAWTSVQTLEASLGGGRPRGWWTAGGTLLGGAAGAALMARHWDPDECRPKGGPGLIGGGLGSCERTARSDAVLQYVVSGAILGGAVGYLLAGSERWKPVPVPPRVRLEARGSTERTGISASTPF
jgi:hypothetical protein